jgi:hypothetical protein
MTTVEILSIVRKSIGDYKTVPTRITGEIVADGYTDTGDGTIIYYTVNLPITSDSEEDVYFLGGRWNYEIIDSGTTGTRWIQWISESGMFVLNTGTSVEVTSGDIVKIGYTYDSPQEYDFRDSDLLVYIGNAASFINQETFDYTAFTTTGSAYDGTLTITPEPSTYVGILIGKIAQLEARRQIESEGNTSAIYVRQGEITIDTTKGGKDRLDSIKTLKQDVSSMINTINLGNITGNTVDVYSTYDDDPTDQGYYQETTDTDEVVVE